MSSSRADCELAIRAERLGKRYWLGQGVSHDTLRDTLTHAFRVGVQRLWHCESKATASIWALTDVSVEIRRGEIVGIIGRNGAGKSTFLKILSRVTCPTEGWLEGYGRVGSLLEVGTGFHPELTGRENIYLSGAVLGMKRAEINRKFDAIAAFAEIDRFLDTPVKRYSSGMFVRLGFAVAAHLEPAILVIDEVLAVGDAMFQDKCLTRIREIAASGCTVLFVSHNLNSVRSLCQRAIWLSDGRLMDDGKSGETVNNYLLSLEQTSQQPLAERSSRGGSGRIRLTSIDYRMAVASLPLVLLREERPASSFEPPAPVRD